MPDPITRLNAALEGRCIERDLGEGGMATADDLKHERKVALKVLKPELAAVVGAERLLAEIKTTANLRAAFGRVMGSMDIRRRCDSHARSASYRKLCQAPS